MNKSEKERVEGSEVIAKYCNLKRVLDQDCLPDRPEYHWEDEAGNQYNLMGSEQHWPMESPPPFHTSWDWQIPAYSKAMKQLKELAVRDSEAHEYYFKAIENYESAVFNNDTNAGFKTLVEAIKFHNSHSQ